MSRFFEGVAEEALAVSQRLCPKVPKENVYKCCHSNVGSLNNGQPFCQRRKGNGEERERQPPLLFDLRIRAKLYKPQLCLEDW